MAHMAHPGSKTNSGEGERQPIPMFMYDLKTWAILEVNTARIEKHGYSRDEFQALTLKGILPAQDAGVRLRFGNAEILHTPPKAGRNRAMLCDTNQMREI